MDYTCECMRGRAPSLYWSRARASQKSIRKQALRIHSVALLLCFLLSSMLLSINTERASAQPDHITTARTDIVAAFQSIQTAQRQGVSNSDILHLINQLNLALQYEQNATLLEAQNRTAAADDEAIQSISLSNSVSLEAQRLGSEAQSSSTRRSALVYGLALLTAVFAAIAVVEAPRARRLLAKRQLRKARIVHGEEKDAK